MPILAAAGMCVEILVPSGAEFLQRRGVVVILASFLRDWWCCGGDVYARGVSVARRMKDSLKCMQKCLYFGYN